MLSRTSAQEPFDRTLIELALLYARRFGARAQDAEDVAQDALLKLVMSTTEIENPATWLYVVVRRQLARERRRMARAAPEVAPTADPWPEVELSVDARRLVARLSARAQLSLRLSLAGYSEIEMARRLGCSVKATEKTLHKARQQVRRLFTGDQTAAAG